MKGKGDSKDLLGVRTKVDGGSGDRKLAFVEPFAVFIRYGSQPQVSFSPLTGSHHNPLSVW